jgi:putative MATE family efflux protein
MNLSFLRDRSFLRELLVIAFPISLQQLFTAALNMIDVVMVGQLGETAIAALGLANQIFFVFILILFGATSGMAIFTAQYWGKQEIEPIRKALGMSLIVSVSVALLFTLVALLIPETALGFYTKDAKVIELGSGYLRIVGFTYVPIAIAIAYIAVLRSVQLIRLTVIATVSALAFKTALGYGLIFGIAGLPALGVRGAAIGTAAGWTLELGLLLVLVYAQRTPLTANPLTFFSFEVSFFTRVLKTALPAVANEFFWSLGITTYNAIYAHISTDAIAAVNVNATIEELGFVIFIGLVNACSVLVGNHIGAGQKEKAHEIVRRVIILGVFFAVCVGVLIVLLRGVVIGFYELSPIGAKNVRWLLVVMAASLPIRMVCFCVIIGGLRPGGDTRFAMVMELCSIWLIGVPAAYVGAFVLNLPVYLVYSMVMLEELAKALVSLWRYRSKKWIHDLVNAPVAMP